jgi:hypothetical protein
MGIVTRRDDDHIDLPSRKAESASVVVASNPNFLAAFTPVRPLLDTTVARCAPADLKAGINTAVA